MTISLGLYPPGVKDKLRIYIVSSLKRKRKASRTKTTKVEY